MYRMPRLIFAACTSALLIAAPSSSAFSLTIDLIPTTAVSGVTPGDIVAFDIILDFTDDPTLGGGFDLTFDESQLQLIGFSDTILLGDPQFGLLPTYVEGSGLLESWAIADFVGIAYGLIGSVEFVVRPGATTSVVALGPTNGLGGPWQSATFPACCQDVDYGAVTVSAIPLPAAAWLLSGALVTISALWSRPRRAR